MLDQVVGNSPSCMHQLGVGCPGVATKWIDAGYTSNCYSTDMMVYSMSRPDAGISPWRVAPGGASRLAAKAGRFLTHLTKTSDGQIAQLWGGDAFAWKISGAPGIYAKL
eukprot:1570833-Amphidinium_carterae.1